MNNFREFEKIAIRRIALSTFRTTGPRSITPSINMASINMEPDFANSLRREIYGIFTNKTIT